MTSGCSAAIFSSSSSLPPTTSGVAPPRASCAHGRDSSGYSPMKSRTPTGTTPSARAKSASLNPTVTTRCGAEGIVVLPKACSIVTGKAGGARSVGAIGARSARAHPRSREGGREQGDQYGDGGSRTGTGSSSPG